jgi:hypothetical protein
MSRVGKIARLSQCLREQLNRRIEDGELGRRLVKWLNSCDEVQETLDEHFDGRPITEQNLSEWKQGGFKDWQHHQETRALAREFLAEAEELEEEIGETPLTDHLTEIVALTLAQLLREAVNGEKGPAQRMAILEIARELARLRKQDHQMQRLRREQEILEQKEAAERKAEIEAMQEKIRDAKIETEVWANMLRQKYCEDAKAGTLDPEHTADLRKLFARNAGWLRKCGVKDLPLNGAEPPTHKPNPSESDQIRPKKQPGPTSPVVGGGLFTAPRLRKIR